MSLRSYGQRNGGVRTLEDLEERCRVDEDTECWHWLGAKNSHQTGMVYLPELRSTKTVVSAALILSGRKPGRGQIGFITCGSPDCCNPAHVKRGTRAEWGAFIAAAKRFHGSPKRVAAHAALCRKRRSLTDEQAREIRMSEEPGVVLAQRYGVSPKIISRVRRGENYRDQLAANASVFNWRPAA